MALRSVDGAPPHIPSTYPLWYLYYLWYFYSLHSVDGASRLKDA